MQLPTMAFARDLRLQFGPPPPGGGQFIVVEGTSCAGKTTVVQRLASLTPGCVTVEWNSHPGVRPCVDQLKRDMALSPMGHLLAGLLDHRVTLDTVVLPALREGRTVISDRYLFTSVARDGLRGIPAAAFTGLAEQYPAPDAAYLVSVTQDERMRRYRRKRASYGPYACGQDIFPELAAEQAFDRYTALQQEVYRNLAETHGFIDAEVLAAGTDPA